jgi:cyclopropane fatty-acyl-phospholipid synthase-like methyltransferase
VKPFSEACERNREPILAELKRIFADRKRALEIGSGTGQHATYFAAALPHLVWQPSDVAEHLPGIRQWVTEAGAANLRMPLELDVERAWPDTAADAVFSANTCHIMSWPQVERMFGGIGRLLPAGGVFALYGPFNYGGRHSAESNARFDAMLRERDPQSGVRDAEAIAAIAQREYLARQDDIAMPANNRLLIFRKDSSHE